ncbi:MAG: tellurite resistance/C4-dicarboxylate transporter family protein [Candidatus Scalindua sp.]|nr:tellurite resistance/C4-dicarboxylate transporter family protein [Candidatus Scalindua sp.]
MSFIKESIKTLHPAYFAMVMSTGIISIASRLLGFTDIAWALFYINVIVYTILLPFQTLRVFIYWDSLYKDLCNPKLSLVFFTTVAATNVLGAQFITIVNQPEIAKIFWYFGIFLWVAVSLFSFSILFVKCEEGPEAVIHGGWLIATVGTQSVAVLGAALASQFVTSSSFVMFASIVWWMIGAFLYVVLIILLFYRLVFFKLAPEALIPPYWINMGAIAITTLAGSIICLSAPKIGGIYTEFVPFIKGFTLFFWSFGTWWIPLLIILGIWKFVIHKVPFTYTPLDWGMVFPLGMYTACTFKLSEALQIPFISNISEYFIYPAYAAWVFTFIGMITAMVKSLGKKETPAP